MTITIKPKVYGPVRVDFKSEDSLMLSTESGNRIRAGSTSTGEALSPSDLILGSLSACVAISMRMAARQLGLEPGEIQVSAVAIKATDLPNRFGRFEVVVDPGVTMQADQQDELLRRTKALCTVSNTLGAEIDLRIAPVTAPDA